MRITAFCPAHVTGFFKATMVGAGGNMLAAGSTGAGFSIKDGVRTTVDATVSDAPRVEISASGYSVGDMAVSESVIAKYEAMARGTQKISVYHEIGIPVGYGLGCSAAAALSLSLALNAALGTHLSKNEVAQIAHAAEIECRTGLGDVLGVLDGGFEIRTAAGAPGVGCVERTDSDLHVVLVCLAPVSTRRFISERIGSINGLGGKMVDELCALRSYERFQEMSASFARHIDATTPQMQKIMDGLAKSGIRCGVALFGQTIFALVDRVDEKRVLGALAPCGSARIICSRIDNIGARLERWEA